MSALSHFDGMEPPACELRLRDCTGWGTTRDHIVPKSRGGSNWPQNIRRACEPCNTRKANRLDSEFTEKDFAVGDPRREQARIAAEQERLAG